MRARLALVVALLAALGCGGFFDDLALEGQDAVDRLGGVSGAPLPPGVVEARVVETTGIDWLMVGEAAGSRAELDVWFDALVLPCDQVTSAEPDGEPGFLHALHPGTWKSPTGALWRLKRCEGSQYSGPHYGVGITVDGDPAWVWVHGLTM